VPYPVKIFIIRLYRQILLKRFWVLISRRMRWAGHVTRGRKWSNVYRVLVGKPERKDHLEDQGVDGRIVSKWTLRELVGGGVWSGFTWLRIGTVGELL
jgi:hypothetical protein